MEYLSLISNIIIIGGSVLWLIVKFISFERIKSYFGVKVHKSNILNEYRLRRYDSLIDDFEEIITKEQPKEFKALNKIYARMLLSASDETLRSFLKSTKTKLDKQTRNEVYFQIRKELQPNTKIKIEEVQNILYTEVKK